MIQEYIRREGDGKATGRRVAAARHGGASNVPRPPSFVLPSLSFQTRWVRRSHPSVVRPFLVRAPLSFVRHSRSFATLPFLVRSPPSVVRHSPATLGPPNPRASRDSGERRGGGLERPDVESLKPNESRVVAPRQPRIAVPALGVPLANHRRRVRSPPSRAPNSRRDRVSLCPSDRVPLLSEERHRATFASRRRDRGAPDALEIHGNAVLTRELDVPLSRGANAPRRARHRHAKSLRSRRRRYEGTAVWTVRDCLGVHRPHRAPRRRRRVRRGRRRVRRVFLGRVADESSFRSLGGVFSRTLEPRGMERIVKRHLSVVRSRDDASLAKPRGGELEKTTRERLAPTSGDGREGIARVPQRGLLHAVPRREDQMREIFGRLVVLVVLVVLGRARDGALRTPRGEYDDGETRANRPEPRRRRASARSTRRRTRRRFPRRVCRATPRRTSRARARRRTRAARRRRARRRARRLAGSRLAGSKNRSPSRARARARARSIPRRVRRPGRRRVVLRRRRRTRGRARPGNDTIEGRARIRLRAPIRAPRTRTRCPRPSARRRRVGFGRACVWSRRRFRTREGRSRAGRAVGAPTPGRARGRVPRRACRSGARRCYPPCTPRRGDARRTRRREGTSPGATPVRPRTRRCPRERARACSRWRGRPREARRRWRNDGRRRTRSRRGIARRGRRGARGGSDGRSSRWMLRWTARRRETRARPRRGADATRVVRCSSARRSRRVAHARAVRIWSNDSSVSSLLGRGDVRDLTRSPRTPCKR